METHPQVIIVGGPNGSGKSTIARKLVPAYGVKEFVNADVIARGLSAMQTGLPWRLRRAGSCSRSRDDFAFETTLSARTYASWIRRLCGEDWIFRLIFVTLRNADLAVERVGRRVIAGGHSIPEEDIRRRFSRAQGISASFTCRSRANGRCTTIRFGPARAELQRANRGARRV